MVFRTPSGSRVLTSFSLAHRVIECNCFNIPPFLFFVFNSKIAENGKAVCHGRYMMLPAMLHIGKYMWLMFCSLFAIFVSFFFYFLTGEDTPI